MGVTKTLSGLILCDSSIDSNYLFVAPAPNTLPIEVLSEVYIHCDTSAGAISINLPSISTLGYYNAKIYVVDIGGNAGANNITIVADGLDTINSMATMTLNVNYESSALFIVSNTQFLGVQGVTSSGGGGVSYPISITYANLVSRIGLNALLQGQQYLINDYQTIYDQPDYDSLGAPKVVVPTLSGPIEPLLVTAVSVNDISSTVFSTIYPLDQIQYNWNFQTTEVMGQPAKGRISERITGENNNRTSYDHRAVVFKRYLNPSTGLFTIINDNGEVSNDAIPTFGADCFNMFLGGIFHGLNKFTAFILPNSIFGDDCNSTSTISDFYNNTIGNACTSTAFGTICLKNIIGNNFQNNHIGNGFSDNTITEEFMSNTIGNEFNQNSIGGGFLNNIIGNNFGLNEINDVSIEYNFDANFINGGFIGNRINNSYFQSNQIGDYFQNNDIDSQGNEFLGNTIGDYFINNSSIGNSFSLNEISSYFYNNTNIGAGFSTNKISFNFYGNSNIGTDFYNNEIATDFNSNINIGNGFTINSIGSYFQSNTGIGNNFESNQIGNVFQSNSTIGDDFKNNQIGTNFRSNSDIGTNFFNNKIGNYFEGNTTIDINFVGNQIGNNFGSNDTIGNNFNGNLIGSGFSSNYNIGNNFKDNNIGNNFYSNNNIGNTFQSNNIANNFTTNNNIGDSFQYNQIGTGFNSNNDIGTNFEHNQIGNGFEVNNTIGSGFSSNSISNNFYSNSNIPNNFNNNNILCSVTLISFAGATYVIQTYTKNIFQGNLGTFYLEYFDEGTTDWAYVTPINS